MAHAVLCERCMQRILVRIRGCQHRHRVWMFPIKALAVTCRWPAAAGRRPPGRRTRMQTSCLARPQASSIGLRVDLYP
jgi:hypothetical protein